MHAWGYLQLLFREKLPAKTDRSSFTGPRLLYQRSRKTTDHLGFITTKKSPSPWTFLFLLLLTLSHLSPGFSWWFPWHQKNQLWSDNWPLDYVELGLYVTTLEFIYFIFYFFVWICICKCKFKQGFCVLQTESTISNYMKVSLQKGQLLENVKVLACSYNGACMGLDCYYFMQKG